MKDIKDYNNSLPDEDRRICEFLMAEINRALPDAECKIWHGSPVWFIDGNPIVGYHKLKERVRLLFWSGQLFEEKGLAPEGSFKAAEASYTKSNQLNTKDIRRWLGKAGKIQLDYKNIVKNKGRLERIK